MPRSPQHRRDDLKRDYPPLRLQAATIVGNLAILQGEKLAVSVGAPDALDRAVPLLVEDGAEALRVRVVALARRRQITEVVDGHDAATNVALAYGAPRLRVERTGDVERAAGAGFPAGSVGLHVQAVQHALDHHLHVRVLLDFETLILGVGDGPGEQGQTTKRLHSKSASLHETPPRKQLSLVCCRSKLRSRLRVPAGFPRAHHATCSQFLNNASVRSN